MKTLLRFVLRILLFAVLCFVFLVLFQYGPSRFLEGAVAEAKWVQSLVAGGAKQTKAPEPAGKAQAVPAPTEKK